MVLKVPEAGPAPIFEFARMVEQAGFPPGVVNVVTGFGEPRGRALTSHPRVARMAINGGPDTTRQVVRNTAENFAVTSLERGGKSPFIVFGAPPPATSAARCAWRGACATASPGSTPRTPVKIRVNFRHIHEEAKFNHHFFGAAGLALVALFAFAGGAMSTIALAEELPDAVAASPDVYKVIAENESLRVIAATWEPGQRDMMHSHPAIGVYILSDCDNMRAHLADGTSRDWSAKIGNAGANNPVASHAIENIGDTVRRLDFFEPN